MVPLEIGSVVNTPRPAPGSPLSCMVRRGSLVGLYGKTRSLDRTSATFGYSVVTDGAYKIPVGQLAGGWISYFLSCCVMLFNRC